MRSPCQLSIDSISAEALAAAAVSPFPCEVASDLELGRTATYTGSPIRSRPATLASRVIPNFGMSGT